MSRNDQRSRPRPIITLRRLSTLTLVALAIGSLTGPFAAGAQEAPVVRGGANASADSMGFQIINAGASLGWTFGRSTAAYRDITASSQGKAVDLGALEALLGQPQCGGELPPALDLATVPPKTIAESTNKGADKPITAEVNFPRLTGDKSKDRVVGTQTASANPHPASQSSTTTRNQDFGFFRVEGATSEARTSFSNGVRLAEAEVSAKRIVVLGGQVVFYDPTWTARATSGAETTSQADFTFGSAQVFGNWVSGAVLERDLAFFETLVEGLLGSLGLDLEFPEARQPPGAQGIEITPMSFTMSNAPIGKGLLIPLLNTELLQNYRKDSVSEDCRRETFWTIIDAVERALGGSGSIQMLVGGATATTDDTDYSFKPFESDTTTTVAPTTAAPAPVATDFGDSGGVGEGDTGFTGDDFGGDYSDLGTDLDAGLIDDFGDTGNLDTSLDEGLPDEVAAEVSDESTSRPESENGREIAAGASDTTDDNVAAVVVGIAALLGALGLSMGDRLVAMRARRRID